MGMSPVPAGTRISQEFGKFPGGYNPAGGHTGRDYAANMGTVLVAPEDAIVRWASNGMNLPGGPMDWAVRWYFDKAYPGELIVLEVPKWGALFAVAHCLDFSVRVGERVRKGQRIGRTGNTGAATTGPHAHVEVIPLSYMWGNGTYGRVHPGPYLTEPYRPLGGIVETPQTTRLRVLDGVDVSAYQPADIVRLVPAGFVIVKTTEGAGWVSDRWKTQLADARALGREVGVYHYARPGNNSSDAEARFFVNTVKKAGMDSPGLTYWLDWEESDFYGYTEWARDFMREVDRLTGKTTGLYANTAGMTGGYWELKDRRRPLWRAIPVYSGPGYATSFHLAAPAGGFTNLVLDQYSFYGRLPGYAGDLDLNVYYGGLLPWGATGAPTSKRNLLEEIMSTPAERKAFAREVALAALSYRNEKVVGKNGPDVYALLVKAAGTLDERIPVTGSDPEGNPYKGTTSLRQEAGWGTFRGFRDRRIEAASTAGAEGVEELKGLVDSLSLLLVEVLGDKLPALPGADEEAAGEETPAGENDEQKEA